MVKSGKRKWHLKRNVHLYMIRLVAVHYHHELHVFDNCVSKHTFSINLTYHVTNIFQYHWGVRNSLIQYIMASLWVGPSGPFYWHGLTLIPAWISNHIYHDMWGDNTYPFSKFNSTGHVFIYTGSRFSNGFSIAIQIRWKFCFTLISILIQWSLQNFVYGTTAVLSWHVQKFVAVWSPTTELQLGEVSIEFEHWQMVPFLSYIYDCNRSHFPDWHFGASENDMYMVMLLLERICLFRAKFFEGCVNKRIPGSRCSHRL